MTDAARATIFALSSGRPPAAIAVIRISGPRAGDALKSLAGKIPAPRLGALARVRDPRSNEIIDEALVLWFPAPHSETGEDTAELQLHGGRAVIAAVLDALGTIEGLKPAEAGEFTRRAFENGKLDLTAVEGLADLVSAETEGQRRQAFRQMKGLLGNRAETWRQRLIQAQAQVEAGIDFSDEGDVQNSAQNSADGNLAAGALTIARELADEIAQALADGGRGERLREGLVVAIAGPPNAGKSTLLNLLAKREAAIVSPSAGTTRDVIEVHLDLAGWPVTLLDTAGIRDSDDPVEREGVRRARERAAGADLVLWVVDASAGGPMAEPPMADWGNAPADSGDFGRSAAPGGPGRPMAASARGAGVAAGPDGSGPNGPGRPPAASASGNEMVGRRSQSNVETSPGSAKNTETTAVSTSGAAGPGATEPNGPAWPLAASTNPDRFAGGQASAPAPLPPLVWLIRNKIDLVQVVNSNELGKQNIDKNEHVLRTNKTLKTMVNSELTQRNEPVLHTNKALRTMVNERLTAQKGKNEPISVSNGLEFNLSASSGAGFDVLLDKLAGQAKDFLAGAEQALVTRARHRHALEEVLAALRRAMGGDCAGREDLLAEELRIASRALGRLTGRVDVEDILDVIFRDFCIGK
jgi:tRNA modification GTPase